MQQRTPHCLCRGLLDTVSAHGCRIAPILSMALMIVSSVPLCELRPFFNAQLTYPSSKHAQRQSRNRNMGRFWGLRTPGSQAMPGPATILLRPHQHEGWDALAWLGEMILTAGMAAGPQKSGSQESQDGLTD